MTLVDLRVIISTSTKGYFMFLFHSFTIIDIIAAVNKELSLKGFRTRVKRIGRNKDNVFELFTERGAKLVAELMKDDEMGSVMRIKSLYRIKSKKLEYALPTSTKYAVNLTELFNNECSGPKTYCGAEQFKRYLTDLRGADNAKRIEQDLIDASKVNASILTDLALEAN